MREDHAGELLAKVSDALLLGEGPFYVSLHTGDPRTTPPVTREVQSVNFAQGPAGPLVIEEITFHDAADPCTAPVLIGGCDCSCQQCEIGYHCRNAARNCLH